jgi:hypothetical protein
MVTYTTQELAKRVSKARKQAEYPVLRLSTATGIPKSTLKRKLDGYSDFTIPELQALSQQLGVKCSEWLEGLIEAA